jgi:hypothetical protein
MDGGAYLCPVPHRGDPTATPVAASQVERGPATQGSDWVKPFKSWSVKEVWKFATLSDPSEVPLWTRQTQWKKMVEGQFFLDVMKNDDQELRSSIQDGGLGFTNLQLKCVKD